MPSIDVERRYVDVFSNWNNWKIDQIDLPKVRQLKHLLRRYAPPGDTRSPVVPFERMFDATVGTLHELTEGAQACSNSDMLRRHIDFSIESLQILRRRA